MATTLAWLRRRHSREVSQLHQLHGLTPLPNVPVVQDRAESPELNLLDEMPMSLSPPRRTESQIAQRLPLVSKSKKAVDGSQSAPVGGWRSGDRERSKADRAQSATRNSVSAPVRELSKRPRRFSQGSAPPMPRALSFAADDPLVVAEAIAQEEPDLDWLPELWQVCLQGKPLLASRSLSFTSLTSWVAVFNRWQALGDWTPGQAPQVVDGKQLQELMAAPASKVAEWAKMLDPKATSGGSEKFNMPAFLSLALVLSSAVSKMQKIRFLLGVFDENDNLAFEETEFSACISAFLRGIACAFGCFVEREKSLQQSARRFAKKCFQRLSCEGRIDFAQLEAWFLGAMGDPLAVPFALLLERQSGGADDNPELFLEDDQKFRLSHRHPVQPPMEMARVLDVSFLHRHEIRAIRDVFHAGEKLGFDMSHAEAERRTGSLIDPELWCKKIARALEQVQELRLNGSKISLPMLLKCVCPRADARHLRMFQSWLRELKATEELKARKEHAEVMLGRFLSYTTAPVLSPTQQLLLLKDFDMLQQHGVADAKLPAPEHLLKFQDEVRDDRLETSEIVSLMCPADCRPCEANALVDGAIGSFLKLRLLDRGKAVAEKEALFTRNAKDQKKSFYKPRASRELWQRWLQFIETFEEEMMGRHVVTLKRLLRSGLVCPEIAEDLCRDLGSQDGFAREAFLSEMLRLNGLRSPPSVPSF